MKPLKLISSSTTTTPATTPARAADPGQGLDWSNEPASLAADGLTEWRRLGNVYGVDASKFTEGDRATVYAFCSIWADFLAAERLLNQDGLTVAGRSSADQARGGQVKHPALQAKREATQQLRYLATALKLTPAARSLTDQVLGDTGNPFA